MGVVIVIAVSVLFFWCGYKCGQEQGKIEDFEKMM